MQCDILRTVQAQDLKVSMSADDGCIGAVTALEAIYSSGGPKVLARTLHIARDAYAKDREAFRGSVLRGLALVCSRYDGQLDTTHAVSKLAKVSGGALGLVGKSNTVQRATGKPIAQCIAATIVDTVNAGVNPRSPERLENWWK